MYLTYIYASPAHAEPTHRCASNAPNSPAHTRIFVSHKTKASSAPLSPLLSSNRLCPRSHRCTGFKKRDTTEAALLARAASGLSLVAGERGGLISSRTARGVRVNLVLAMVFHRHVRRKAVLFAATRAQAAEAGLMLHKLASSWLRGEASMDSYCLRAG